MSPLRGLGDRKGSPLQIDYIPLPPSKGEDYQLPATNYQLPTTSYFLEKPIISSNFAARLVNKGNEQADEESSKPVYGYTLCGYSY